MSLRHVANKPRLPSVAVYFFFWELHIPSVCLTNLKSSFPGFDCLCVRSHKEGRRERKRTREEEGRGGEREGGDSGCLYPFPLGLFGLIFSNHPPNICLGIEPLCPWFCHYLYFRGRNSLNFNVCAPQHYLWNVLVSIQNTRVD